MVWWEFATLNEISRASTPPDNADALLVARIRAGDEDAFDLLVQRYQVPIFRYLRGLVADSEQARDLAQDTFLRAYRSLDSLHDPHLLRSWLYRIAHNQAYSLLRRRRLVHWLPLLPSRPDHAPLTERSAIEAAHVEAALAHVPLEQRAPLLLHLVAGFSYTEIAALLHISEGAVRMRVSRGRAAFRAAYGAREDDDAF